MTEMVRNVPDDRLRRMLLAILEIRDEPLSLRRIEIDLTFFGYDLDTFAIRDAAEYLIREGDVKRTPQRLLARRR